MADSRIYKDIIAVISFEFPAAKTLYNKGTLVFELRGQLVDDKPYSDPVMFDIAPIKKRNLLKLR